MVQFRKRKSDGQSFPIGSTRKLRANNPSNDVGGIKIGSGIKKGSSLTNNDKQILHDWVKQNPNWKSIDDLPNEIFIPLVSSAGDDIDKRVEIQVQAIDFMKSITRTDPSDTTFFQGGKAFKVELDKSLGIISVDERFQGSDNVWHTGKNIFFAQGEDGQEIAEGAGGFFVDKIMEFLDSSGALEGAR